MDSANSSTTSMPNNFLPPPPGLNYIAAIQPSLIFLMIGTSWGGILLPLLVALFYFSTKELRRKPVFILNVLAILLGLFLSIMNAVIEVIPELHYPFRLWTMVVFTIGDSFTPWLVELILVLRLVTVYPISRTPRRTWCAIFIPLGLIKIGRMINITIYCAQYTKLLQNPNFQNPISVGQSSWHSQPGTKIEWTLQVVDNTVTSALFIWRLRSGLHVPGVVESDINYRSYASKVKALFWIAVSNFIFPVILSIFQLIMLFRDPDFLIGSYTYLTNDFVEIVGVMLATVWASSSNWSSTNSASLAHPTITSSAPQFARNIHLENFQAFDSIAREENTGTASHLELNSLKSGHDIEFGPVESHLEFSSNDEEKAPVK
ncbi:hypothetical protein JR316_0011819 [Psilocybe cubensis]|uniref:Uncharacterized protein n=2 Tax=Psilocybe cubensis TaxID=181762 RepID=A0A8H8CF93_PSICU|nr:hypothetical protein JR316_0011819 [Psilocybe cubensis]KAH9476248.1 hypothetical protein JR316_0011819 [Psilocybe cubensis]